METGRLETFSDGVFAIAATLLNRPSFGRRLFVQVSFHDHRDDEVNPIASTAAFAHFQDDHEDRRQGGVDQQTATLVGAYFTVIE